MKNRDPKPEIQRLEELVSSIRSGEIRLPKFQRPFVWSKGDMLDLLDSIYNGYPIGSILLWHSSERLKSERAIEGFEVSTSSVDSYPTNYLLDGQQRLTTLCGSLFWDGVDQSSMWRIFFDLETEKFTYHKGPVPVNLFPLNRLMRTSEFIKQCMKFEQSQNSKKYYEVAEKLLQSIKDYKIAVVKIGDISLDEVAPIFERINSTGRKLTMVDLMRAATWKDGFDLSNVIDRIISKVDEVGYGEISDTNILRSIAAAAGLGINKEDIDKLRECSALQLQNAADLAEVGTLQALDFLRHNAGMDDLSFLPYGLQLAHLAEFFRINSAPTSLVEQKLLQWFWATSAARYFAGASTGQNAKDLAAIRRFALGDTGALTFSEKIDISQLLFDQFNLRNASSTTFALLLKSSNVNSNIYGRPFDRTHIKEMDRHIFESLKSTYGSTNSKNIEQTINPFKGLERPHELQHASKDLLHSHFLNEDCVKHLLQGEFDQVTRIRAKIVAATLKNLTGKIIEFELPVVG